MPRETDRPATGRGLVVWSGESFPAARPGDPREVVRVAAPAPPRSVQAPSFTTPRPTQTRVAVSSPAKPAPLASTPKPVTVRPIPAPAAAMWSAPKPVATVDSFPRYQSSSPSAFGRWTDAPPPAPSTYPESRTMHPNDQPECATDFRRCRGTGTGGCLHGTCALCLAERKGVFQWLLDFLYGLVKRGVSKAAAFFGDSRT
jgi:hypothetical protein